MDLHQISFKAATGVLHTLFKKFYKNIDKNRDEDERLVTNIEATVTELCKLGSEYWARDYDPNDTKLRNLQRQIIVQFSLLSRHINKLRLHGINCETHFLRFKQCITGGHFESTTRVANHAIVNVEIPKHAGALTAVLQSSYCQIYRKN